MELEILSQLYTSCVGCAPDQIMPLPASGSHRRYFRLTGKMALIGVVGEALAENRAFLYLSRHFRGKGLPVPRVWSVSADGLCYLQEDLGDVSLFDALASGRAAGSFSAEEQALLRATLVALTDVQVKGADGLDYEQCYPQPAFDKRCVHWDLNYFKYCFLRPSGIDFQEDRLEDDFERMADVLTADQEENTFMYRDFQSRNVMVRDGQPWFIDFQGGRRGPLYYDVASFLWQAKARYPDTLREELLHTYVEALRRYRPVDEELFKARLRHFVLFRTLQVLGAYGFRGYFERKPHFLESIPFALDNLGQLLQTPFAEYPYLCEVLQQLIARLRPEIPAALADGLTVSVYSFSYRVGIPEDTSGNGGGFVFDCRAIHNPGRYDRFKPLTGLDEPVIRFLEDDGEITVFLQHAYALVDAAVRRYQARGFTHLSVAFGCTGGRHRSVYAAQHLAEHVHQTFGVRVELEHHEQGISQIWEGHV